MGGLRRRGRQRRGDLATVMEQCRRDTMMAPGPAAAALPRLNYDQRP